MLDILPCIYTFYVRNRWLLNYVLFYLKGISFDSSILWRSVSNKIQKKYKYRFEKKNKLTTIRMYASVSKIESDRLR